MRLLFITRSQLCENNGGANATKGFLQCFASLFEDCSIICPIFEDMGQVIPSKYKMYPYIDKRSRIRKGLDVYRGVICANHSFVKQHLRVHQYDVIVIDHSFTGASLTGAIKATGAKVITIHHNVERDYLRDNVMEHSIVYRYPYLYFSRKAEIDCLLTSDVNITLTVKDANTFRSWYEDINLHLHPWSICEYRHIADKHFVPREKGLIFVVTGSLYFMQSLFPIMEFINSYWPLLQSAYPQAKLLVAGRNPAESLKQLCANHEGITLIPNPEDMAAVVSQADYYVCPINAGSGIKLRVLDGLKQGLPVLCHEVSAAGYEHLEAAKCLFSYKDEQTFSVALRKMVEAQTTKDEVYKLFQDTFSIRNRTIGLDEILKEEKIL